jgi:hypothetical protein
MRFAGRDIEISRRSIWVMCSVAATVTGVAIALSLVLRAPQGPIETDGPTSAPASLATSSTVVTQ